MHNRQHGLFSNLNNSVFYVLNHAFLTADPGRDIVGGDRVRELPGHYCDDFKPLGFDTKNIFLSPSIHYSGHSAYAKPVR